MKRSREEVHVNTVVSKKSLGYKAALGEKRLR